MLSEYHQHRSIILTKRWVCQLLQKSSTHRSNIIQWERWFLETVNTGLGVGNGRQGTSAKISRKVKAFKNDSTFSFRAASSKMKLSPTTVLRILHECIFLFPYMFQNIQAYKEGDKQKWLELLNIVLHPQRVAQNTY